MDSVAEGEGGKIWENGIETCKISCMKRVASPGSMHDTGCLGLVYPFRVSFCGWCKIGVQFHSFACGYLVFPT